MSVNISLKRIAEDQIETEALILPLFEDSFLDFYSSIDNKIGGIIKKVIESKEFQAKSNQITLLHVTNIKPERILLVGLGKISDLTSERLRQAGGRSLSFLSNTGLKDVAISTLLFDEISLIKAKNIPIYYFLEGGLLGLYRFKRYKKNENFKDIKNITILSDKEMDLQFLKVIVDSVNFVKDLINSPSNDLTPTTLSSIAKSLSNEKINIKILDKEDIEREGMGAYFSVLKGSDEPPMFIIVEYRGGHNDPVILIGKSITFDSGGISLKPAEGMEKMKYDMAGGAVVLGVIKAVSDLNIPLTVVGILPATENLPSGKASRPGDIVKSITGKTIEIVNTDAEGRLCLADAIGYALKYYKPSFIIDIATLTGACSIALGHEAIAMMGNNRELIDKMKAASDETYERVWEMPLYDEYKDYLKSDSADIKNSGGKNGSLVTAAYFLKEFVGDTPWIHLDIASTAWNDKDKPYMQKGATGIGLRLILNFLKEI
jgi:leucyl aminopeptidase